MDQDRVGGLGSLIEKGFQIIKNIINCPERYKENNNLAVQFSARKFPKFRKIIDFCFA